MHGEYGKENEGILSLHQKLLPYEKIFYNFFYNKIKIIDVKPYKKKKAETDGNRTTESQRNFRLKV